MSTELITAGEANQAAMPRPDNMRAYSMALNAMRAEREYYYRQMVEAEQKMLKLDDVVSTLQQLLGETPELISTPQPTQSNGANGQYTNGAATQESLPASQIVDATLTPDSADSPEPEETFPEEFSDRSPTPRFEGSQRERIRALFQTYPNRVYTVKQVADECEMGTPSAAAALSYMVGKQIIRRPRNNAYQLNIASPGSLAVRPDPPRGKNQTEQAMEYMRAHTDRPVMARDIFAAGIGTVQSSQVLLRDMVIKGLLQKVVPNGYILAEQEPPSITPLRGNRDRVLEFLNGRPGKLFSIDELAEATGIKAGSRNNVLRALLSRLASSNEISSDNHGSYAAMTRRG